MGRRLRLLDIMTPKKESFVDDNHESMAVSDMCKKLGIARRTLYRYMEQKGMKTFDKTRKSPTVKVRKRKFAEGCFDVFEKSNWLVG